MWPMIQGERERERFSKNYRRKREAWKGVSIGSRDVGGSKEKG